ncbi:MAG: hypothetical protein MZV70_01665 [Desulfobacterales bacterium]|nr:hypothetical protein [Desulfobacterales bacterium]
MTATSQFDIKVSPLSRLYPGVELQATVFNNLIDGTAVKRAGVILSFSICAALMILTALLTLKLRSVIASSILVALMALLYVSLSAYLLLNHFLWVEVINPLLAITLTFIFMYIVKYLLKSRDR